MKRGALHLFMLVIVSGIALAAVSHPAEQIRPGTFGAGNPGNFIFMNGSIGVNQSSPVCALDVAGSIKTTGLQLADGNQGAGKVLTSDASGNAAWQAAAVGDTRITGEIIMYGGASAPSGWVLCDGSAISRTTYSGLFAVIGTTYGAGDGSTTFNVPDLRGRTPVGVGTGTGGGASGTGLPTGGSALTARSRGSWLGAETHTLSVTEMPSHQHTPPLKAPWQTATWGTTYFAYLYLYTNANVYSGELDAAAGGSGAHNNVQPVMGVNFIIKT